MTYYLNHLNFLHGYFLKKVYTTKLPNDYDNLKHLIGIGIQVGHG